MAMDSATMFEDVVRIARTAPDAGSGWASLVRYLEDHGGESLPQLAAVDLQQDLDKIRGQIETLLRTERPPRGLNAMWFGLFDALAEGGSEAIGYYLAGVKGYDPQDGDTLCDPAWWPKGRYLASVALAAVRGGKRVPGK